MINPKQDQLKPLIKTQSSIENKPGSPEKNRTSTKTLNSIPQDVNDPPSTTSNLDSYNQTHQALKEALSEQTILKQRLLLLEKRNKPAKFYEPVVIRSISAARGSIEDEDFSPERVLFELSKATSLLENARIAADSSANELRELLKATDAYQKQSAIDTEIMVSQNALRHKNELQHEQQLFQLEIQKWNSERSEMLSETEKYSIVSQSTLHKNATISEQVEHQRRQIQKLAAELRNSIKKSKELRDQLDDTKKKVTMIQSLSDEIEANAIKTEELEKKVSEQKAILKAVRISQQAQNILDENSEQIKELREAKENAKEKLSKVLNEKKEAQQLEKFTLEKVVDAQNRFKKAQSDMFVLEADVRELKAEYIKQRKAAIDQGRKNVDLQCLLKTERIDATQRFIIENINQIHKVEKVQSTLFRVKKKLQSRPASAIQQSNNRISAYRQMPQENRKQADKQQKKTKTNPSSAHSMTQRPNSTRKITFRVAEETPRKK